jgi:hypothetical protein
MPLAFRRDKAYLLSGWVMFKTNSQPGIWGVENDLVLCKDATIFDVLRATCGM